MYGPDVTDAELAGVVNGAAEKLASEDRGDGANTASIQNNKGTGSRKLSDSDEVIRRARDWLRGFSCPEGRLIQASPWRPLEDY